MTGFVLFTRRCVAWPPALLGMAFTKVGGWLITFAAWVMDIDLEGE